MAISTCGVQVSGPKPILPKYGLLSVADVSTPLDVHWEGSGVTWNDDLCTEATSISGFVCPPTGDSKEVDRGRNICCAEPYTTLSSYECPPVGVPAGEAFDIARKRLINLEHREVERVFWTGIAGDGAVINPSLQAGNDSCGSVPVDLTPDAGALDPVAAIAVLESALSSCGTGLGVIHGNYGVASYLANHMLLVERNDGWYTPTGQRLALGAGYPGTGPGNVVPDAGTTWLFATGPVSLWRSEIFLTPDRLDQAVDRSLNDVTVFAERIWAGGWNCCLFAVQLSLCCECGS